MIPLDNDRYYFARTNALRTAALVIGAIVVVCIVLGVTVAML
jgi:hypothetical protein